MNEEEYTNGIADNIRDAQREDAPFETNRLEVTRDFEVMGAEQMTDLWLHMTDEADETITIGQIREVLVQAHNFIVIG